VIVCQDRAAAKEFFDRVLSTTMPDTAEYLAFADSHGVIGGWVFERYTGVGGSVFSHWAGRSATWLTRRMLRMSALYVFDQLGCERVYGEVPASDTRVRRIDERLGFKEIATLHGCFPHDDLVLYEMTRVNCRWLPAQNR